MDIRLEFNIYRFTEENKEADHFVTSSGFNYSNMQNESYSSTLVNFIREKFKKWENILINCRTF